MREIGTGEQGLAPAMSWNCLLYPPHRAAGALPNYRTIALNVYSFIQYNFHHGVPGE
jgi:hypothetical protein